MCKSSLIVFDKYRCLSNHVNVTIMTYPNKRSILIIAVTALRAIRRSLIDSNRNLSNWNRGDPCVSNWTGILCFNMTMDDGYLHIKELYDFNLYLIFVLVPECHAHEYCESCL